MTSPILPRSLEERLRAIRSCGAITGAGVSRESGIRTYRGPGGLYDDPETGERTVEALTGTTLVYDPDRTWQVIAALARQAGNARPNAAHRALATMEQRLSSFVLLTQNVDGLHQAAGSRNVIEIHGNIFDTVCMRCGGRGRLERVALESLHAAAPQCRGCGDSLRPDVVLFGELLPRHKLEPLLQEFYLSPPEMVLVAGTSALFPYITEPVMFAQQAGRLTVEINPESTVLSHDVDYALRGPAGLYLPAIARALGALPLGEARRAAAGLADEA